MSKSFGIKPAEDEMRLEITNAVYSTALTYELVANYGVKILGAPTFPSLAEEAFYKADAQQTAIPLFLQYKQGEHFVGNTASLKDYWDTPYYRFVIQSKSKIKNHELLLGLTEISQMVFYAAPEFHTKTEFYRHLMQQTLLERSTFWSPRAIGVLAEKKRYTASYKNGVEHGVLQPGDGRIEGLTRGKALFDIAKHKLEANLFVVFDNDKLLDFGDQMLENFLKAFHSSQEKKLIDDILLGRARMDARDYVSLISILLYDCYIYMITAPVR